jgi:hypothetical protein
MKFSSIKILFYPLFILLVCLQGASMAEDDWKRVYLATYPRAGNHWMRHLIEDASYIATSSVYIDEDEVQNKHLKKSFPWGGYAAPNGYSGKCRYPTKSELVVIKTHFPAFSHVPFDLKPAVKTIRIIRHPVDSFCSFHIFREGPSAASRIPRESLLQLINTWRSFQEYWDNQTNVLTIRYEDLYEDPSRYLKKVLAMLDYEFTDKDIERSVAMNPPRGKLYKHVEGFNAEDLALVEERLSGLMTKYNYTLRSSKDKDKEKPVQEVSL